MNGDIRYWGTSHANESCTSPRLSPGASDSQSRDTLTLTSNLDSLESWMNGVDGTQRQAMERTISILNTMS